MMTEDNEEHSEKHSIPIDVTGTGMVAEVNDEHSENTKIQEI